MHAYSFAYPYTFAYVQKNTCLCEKIEKESEGFSLKCWQVAFED